MEPAQGSVANTRTRVIHTVITTVKAVQEADPTDAAPDKQWWVHFDGSRESLAFLGEKPFEPGDKVKITFERITDGEFS